MSMIQINIQNVEELIFNNKEIWKKMPELVHLRDQWRMSKMTPILRAMGRKSLLDFLKSAKNIHEDILSDHFGTEVTIDKVERHLVKNIEFSIENLDEKEMDFELSEIYTSYSVFRDENKVYVTFWR